MYNCHVTRDLLCILFSLSALTPALDFSKSSLKAFDNSDWGLSSGFEDTVTIHNNSSIKKVVDSLSVEFDSPMYSQYEIGWYEQRNGIGTTRILNSNNFTFNNECAFLSDTIRRGITLSKYKQVKSSEKILFEPNEKIKMFSPHFSTCRADIGINVWCPDGPCIKHFKVDQINNFNGRIIFFTELNQDTLNILCKRTIYSIITSVKNTVASNRTSSPANNHYAVNVMGRKLSFSNKLDAYHSIKLQKEHSIVLH